MSNFVKHKQRSSGFTIIPNLIFKNKNLSLKAKGLLCQLLSLPDTWEYSEMGLVAITTDGRASVRSAIKELEDNRYLIREQTRGSDGKMSKMIYHVYEEPFEPSEDERGELNYTPKEEQVDPSFYYDWMNE